MDVHRRADAVHGRRLHAAMRPMHLLSVLRRHRRRRRMTARPVHFFPNMQKIRADLGQMFFAITLLALSPGCSSSSDSGGDVDGGDAGHDTEVAETKSDADGGGEGGTCDKTGVCCCDGDVIED